MLPNHAITEALFSILASGRLSDAWWTDEAIAIAIRHISGHEVTTYHLNLAVSKDEGHLAYVDNVVGGFNHSRITRVRKKVDGTTRYYFFFAQHVKIPVVPCHSAEWKEINSRPLPRISPRTAASTDIPMVDTPCNAQKRTRARQNEATETTPVARPRVVFPNTDGTPKTPITAPPFERGVWFDAKTNSLFGIEDRIEDVRDALESLIDTMGNALTNVSLVLTPPHESMAEENIPAGTLLHIVSKIRILRLAYSIAIEHYSVDGFTWKRCCERSMNMLHATGERKYSIHTVMKWHRRFRETKTWRHPFELLRQYKPWFFRNHPEAVTIARNHLSKDLKDLCVEKATEYFRGKFLDDVVDLEYGDDLSQDDRAIAKDILLSESKLKTISPATTCRWLAYLGYQYGAHRRVYYTDEHERDDNKTARIEYARTLKQNEIQKYRWVRLTLQQKQEMETLEKDALEQNVHCRTYDNGTLFEYHISRHPRLIEFVSDNNREVHGGDLSREMLRMPGMRPIIEVGQDEAVFQQNAQSAMEWRGPNGESTPRPKSDGDAIMVSAFIGPSVGFGRNTIVSHEALQRINNIRSRRPIYQDKFAAEEVHGHNKKRLFTSEEDVQNALCVRFEHGKHREGYWNHAHMTIQTEDTIDIIQGLFLRHDIELHFDQSSGHKKKRHFGLNTDVMIKSWGGSTPQMRDTVITDGCLGPFQHAQKLKAGDTQSMSFNQLNNLGPWELSQSEREMWKHDRITGKKTTEFKRKKQLMNELKKTNRGTKMEQLKEEAIENGISLTYEIDEVKRGWYGGSKGMLQVLWERGFIDPSKSSTYYKASVPKNWKDENGRLKDQFKEQARTRVLPLMLRACEDFAYEISAMEELANQLSRSTSNVIILFSPKYHCELAGCGIELAWGFSKRVYRRNFSMHEKKYQFKECVDRSLQVVTKDHCCRFLNRVRRYAEAYLLFHENDKDISYALIERFVKRAKTHRSTLDQEFGFINREVDRLEGDGM